MRLAIFALALLASPAVLAQSTASSADYTPSALTTTLFYGNQIDAYAEGLRAGRTAADEVPLRGLKRRAFAGGAAGTWLGLAVPSVALGYGIAATSPRPDLPADLIGGSAEAPYVAGFQEGYTEELIRRRKRSTLKWTLVGVGAMGSAITGRHIYRRL